MTKMKGALLAALGLLSAIDSLRAQQLAPRDWFKPIEEGDRTKLANVDRLEPLQRDSSTRVRVLRTFVDRKQVVLLRFENERCRDECVTAFFKQDIGNASLIGLALLPAATTMGDQFPSAILAVFFGQSFFRVATGTNDLSSSSTMWCWSAVNKGIGG